MTQCAEVILFCSNDVPQTPLGLLLQLDGTCLALATVYRMQTQTQEK